MKFIREGLLLLGIFPASEVVAPGLELVTTTRIGGTSKEPFDSLNLGAETGDGKPNVHKNRRILLKTLGKSSGNIAMGRQVHGSNVRVVERGGLYKDTDGLITGKKGLTLVINTADCFPVVLYSPPEHVVAALHVGSKGLAEGIVEEGAEILTNDFRVDPSTALAFIGPGICKKCYTVDKATAKRFPDYAISQTGKDIHLDLEKLIKLKLKEIGFKKHFIYSAGTCTSCNRELFFSYRRDRGVTGRHWTMATLTS